MGCIWVEGGVWVVNEVFVIGGGIFVLGEEGLYCVFIEREVGLG